MKYERITGQEWNENIDLTQELGYSYIYKRLYELENKIDQGTLIELPCKVGDTVYGFICYRHFGGLIGKIFKGKIVSFYIERGLYLRIEAEHDRGNFYLEYGKDVFLTREEAEKKLQELQG